MLDTTTAIAIHEITLNVSKHKAAKKLRPGYIYLIESTCGTRVKIGRSIDPEKRVRTVSSVSGGHLRNAVSCSVSNAVAIENTLHKYYKAKRVAGEWFECTFTALLPVILGVCKAFEYTSKVDNKCRHISYKEASYFLKGIEDHFSGVKNINKTIADRKEARQSTC